MTDDADEVADDERTIELSAIQAIYPELALDAPEAFAASIDVPIEPYKALPVRFQAPLDPAQSAFIRTASSEALVSEKVDEISADILSTRHEAATRTGALQETQMISYFPPLKLAISLPDGYPAQSAPKFGIESAWVPSSKLQELENHGTQVWEDLGREQAVFAFLDFLRDAADDAFGLLSGEQATLDLPAELSASLLDFDLKTKRAKFEQETFECGVCLEPKKGTVCYRLCVCSHVFCIECLQTCFNASIKEGSISDIKCMAVDCGKQALSNFNLNGHNSDKKKRKKQRTLQPSELLQIPLEPEVVQRYIKLKRKARLESDRTTIYCPRQWCQGPARSKTANSTTSRDADSDSNSETEINNDAPESQSYDPNEPKKFPPPTERLAICEDCTFAFCKVCKASWHGEYYSCFPRRQVELTAEERASEDYMKLHTQPCPTCDARAQKTHGCNHMICFKCSTHFCYLCGAYLESDNPYQHYNNKDRGCYMRLWELEAGDGGDVGQGFGGGNVHEDDADDDEEAQVELFREPPPALVVVAPPARPNRPVQAAPPPAAAAVGGDVPGGAMGRDPGLQRFLAMVQNDEEDEWDSDEMDPGMDWSD